MAHLVKAAGLSVGSLNPPYGRDFYIDDDVAQAAHEAMLATSLRYAESSRHRLSGFSRLGSRPHELHFAS